MRAFIITVLVCLCVHASAYGKMVYSLCRVTYYHPHEDRFGNRIAMCSWLRAREGETVAAEPSVPFGTHLAIPELSGVVGTGNFTVEDRGRDVRRRKASHGRYPVIDVFVESRRKYRWLRDHMRPFLRVIRK